MVRGRGGHLAPRPVTRRDPARIVIVGLGPAGLERLTRHVSDLLIDPGAEVVVRTGRHTAADQLARLRTVETCDDLYDGAPSFSDVYERIAERILDRARTGVVVYAVPGSAAVGERTVPLIEQKALAEGLAVDIHPGESFLDLVWARTGCDPIAGGVQVLDGRALPDPLQLHIPTVITQVDRPQVLADAAVILSRTLPVDTQVTVLDGLGADDEAVTTTTLRDLPGVRIGERTSLYLDPPPNGWFGLIATNRRLRRECPWDREQTHHSLLPHLVEETYETVEALAGLGEDAPGGEPDFGAYADVEEELGDLLLQVVFHATLAEEPGAFGVEEVAEGIRRKLVRRHPHVFGDAAAHDAEAVLTRWEELKSAEKGRDSLMDDVPRALPAIARAGKLQRRAATVGFDWDDAAAVLAKVGEEIDELASVVDDPSAAGAELGDLLFAAVNLARHLSVDPEMALRQANDRFEQRFRTVERLAAEAGRDLAAMTLEEMDELWERAKHPETWEARHADT